jgi:alpha-beta hydrolase superfamily lysophospholipase
VRGNRASSRLVESRMPNAVAAVVAVVLVASLAAGQSEQVEIAPGALVVVGDHRLYLECTGASTKPVVVFEAGGGGSSGDWSAVRRLLPSTLRTCAYDRAGSGKSEAGPRPRTLRQEAYELRALLNAAGVRAPYVLVGQSLGGVLVRLLAASTPADVVGMPQPASRQSVPGRAFGRGCGARGA